MLGVLMCMTAATVAVWMGVRWARVRRYWRDRCVPHLPPHPLLGSLTFITKQNAALWMRENYNRFNAPYLGVWLGWKPALIINCPKLARKILVSDSVIFRDRFVKSSSSDPMGQNLFLAKEPFWSSVRRRLTVAFTSSKLRSVQEMLFIKSHELVKRIEICNDNRKSVDLRTIYADFTTDIIGAAALGVTGDATLTGVSAMRQVTKKMLHITPLKGLELIIMLFLPWLSEILRSCLFNKTEVNYFRKIFKAAVAERGGYENHKNENSDLLDILMNIKRAAAKDGEDFSEDMLVSQALIFLFAGFDTTATVLTFATYELAFAPQKQERLFRELLKAKEKNKDINMSDLSELEYLNCVVKESLRKYSIAGWLERLTSKNYNIDGNLIIEAGTPVYINVTGIHYDAKFYPNPIKFVPERFLTNNKDGKFQPFLTFGDGPRHCIGQRFAYQTLRSTLATLVLNFKLHQLPNSPQPEDVELEENGVFIAPKHSLSVNCVYRENRET